MAALTQRQIQVMEWVEAQGRVVVTQYFADVAPAYLDSPSKSSPEPSTTDPLQQKDNLSRLGTKYLAICQIQSRASEGQCLE